MSLKVSIVIAVYNTGEYIEPLIDSINGQSMPADEFEAIFVDDGSSDDTPERLDRLAVERSNVRVEHIPNSGWPGKPRNVGTEMARGEYIYFVDHDDWLAPEALERMYDMGVRTKSDVVIGKIVGHGRRVPTTLFRRNYEHADVLTAPVVESMTPHKMFRREFLNNRGIRFPEGPRRLEDHLYCVKAYLQADGISVLSDYSCYHHIRRDDAENAGFRELDPVDYFDNLREAIDAVDELAEPGPKRTVIMRRWYRAELLRRVGGAPFVKYADDYRRAIYAEIRKLAVERFTDPAVVEGLSALPRVRSELLLADRFDDLMKLAKCEAGTKVRASATQAAWSGAGVDITVQFEARWPDGSLVELEEDGGDILLRIPIADVTAGARRVTDEATDAEVEIVARERRFDTWVSCESTLAGERRPGMPGPIQFLYSARIDTAKLNANIWDIHSVLAGTGLPRQNKRVEIDQHTEATLCPAVLDVKPRIVIPYRTEAGNLSIDLGQKLKSLPAALDDDLASASPPIPAAVRLPLSLHTTDTSAELSVEVTAESQDGAEYESTTGRIIPEDGHAVLRAHFTKAYRRAHLNVKTRTGKGARGLPKLESRASTWGKKPSRLRRMLGKAERFLRGRG